MLRITRLALRIRQKVKARGRSNPGSGSTSASTMRAQAERAAGARPMTRRVTPRSTIAPASRPPSPQLLDQRLGNFLDRAVEQDEVIGRALGPALGKIADDRVDPRRTGRGGQRLIGFQRDDIEADRLKHRGRIAGARSDHERALAGRGASSLSSRPSAAGGIIARPLAIAQRTVEIGQRTRRLGHEPLALDRAHRRQHAAVGHRLRGGAGCRPSRGGPG